MPAEPEITPEVLKEKLKEFSIFDKDGELLNKGNQVWTDIKNSLNLNQLASSIYIQLYHDRHQIRSSLEKHFGIKKCTIKRKRKEDPEYVPEQCMMQNPHSLPHLNFQIQIPRCELLNVDTGGKKKEWTSTLLLNIRSQKKSIKCVYTFPNSWLTKTKFKFNGYCSDSNCRTSIEGECDRTLEILNISIKTYDTSTIVHTIKIPLSGSRRAQVGELLLTRTATAYREEILSKLPENSEEPQDLNRSNCLRQVREEALSKVLNYYEYKNLSITNKKFIQDCSIRKLSLKPFNIFYWTKKQIEIWNFLSNLQLPVSVDSTGSVVRKYTHYKKVQMRTIYYYVIVIGFEKKIIPLAQTILSAHHVLIVQEFFSKWIESGASIPKEIVSDGSPVLQNAICLAFNGMTYYQYNNHVFRCLYLSEENKLPRCYYRSDISHFMHMVAKWPCLKKCTPNVKTFFMKSIGYMSQIEQISEYLHILRALIIICSSTSTNAVFIENYNMLTQIIKTYENGNLEEFEMSLELINLNDFEGAEKCSLETFVKLYFAKFRSECTQEDEISLQSNNLHYNLEFVDKLQKLSKELPNWTRIAQKAFKSPNNSGVSARSETYFNHKKEDDKIPINAQKFILKDTSRKISARVKTGLETIDKLYPQIKKREECAATKMKLDLENCKPNVEMEKLILSIENQDLSFNLSKINASSPKPLTTKIQTTESLESFNVIKNESNLIANAFLDSITSTHEVRTTTTEQGGKH